MFQLVCSFILKRDNFELEQKNNEGLIFSALLRVIIS